MILNTIKSLRMWSLCFSEGWYPENCIRARTHTHTHTHTHTRFPGRESEKWSIWGKSVSGQVNSRHQVGTYWVCWEPSRAIQVRLIRDEVWVAAWGNVMWDLQTILRAWLLLWVEWNALQGLHEGVCCVIYVSEGWPWLLCGEDEGGGGEGGSRRTG